MTQVTENANIMPEIDMLKRNTYLVKEHTGLFKAANNYDIYDPNSNEIIMECREENLGMISKLLRFTDYKVLTPFDIQIRTQSGRQIVRVSRKATIWRSKVNVFDENNQKIGSLKQKMWSIGGAFIVNDAQDNIVCELKGKWTSWDFKFVKGGTEYAHISKKWAGIAKELFTSADNYVLSISDHVGEQDPIRKLILASVVSIDMILKE